MAFLNLNAKKLSFLALGVTLLAVALQGCGSDDKQATPSSGGSTSGGAVGTAGSTNHAGANNGGSSNDAAGEGPGGAGPGPSEAGAAGMGEAGAGPECTGPDGCYSCDPKTNNQFLNHCVEGGCPAHFDNSTLAKLNLVGTL